MWSMATGVMTETAASMTFVASHRPPMPDLDDGDVDRGIGERGIRDGDEHLEVGHPWTALSHRCGVDQSR